MNNFLKLLVFFIGINHYAQTIFYSETQNVSVEKIESEFNSQMLPNSNINKHAFFKKVFIRDEEALPDLYVTYTYTRDSVLDQIQYVWNESHSQNTSLTISPASQQLLFIEKYHSLLKEITTSYGIGFSTGSTDDLNQITSLFGLYRDDSWTLDHLKINSYIRISNKTQRIGNETNESILKIEVNFQFLNSKINSTFYESNPDFYSLFNEFIKLLKQKEYVKANNYLSFSILETINMDYYEWLRENIDFRKELIVYKSDSQLMADGTENPIIQFKYINDPNPNPTKFISVLFENNGKILGINPKNLDE